MNRGSRRQKTAPQRDSRVGIKPRCSPHLSVALGTAAAIAGVFTGGAVFADGVGNHVKDVKLVAVGPETDVVVVGTSTPDYTAVVEDGGSRLRIDLANADMAGAKPAITDAVGVVGGVLTQEFKDGAAPPRTRLSLSLTRHATFRVRRDGTTLHVTLRPGDVTKVDDSPVPTPAAVVPAATVVTPEIKDVRFERVGPKGALGAGSADAKSCGGGCDRVTVALSAVPSYALTTTPSGNVRLELKGARVTEKAARTVDVSSYQGFIHTVASFYDVGENVAIVEIGRTGDSQGTVSVEGSNLVWSFELPKSVRAALAKNAAQLPGTEVRKVVTLTADPQIPDLPKIETSILGIADGATVATTAQSEAGFTSGVSAQVSGLGHYTGRRIDLDLKDADIHNILRLLADVGHVNIVTGDDVNGNVTIRMRNVPWDEALDVVLQAKGLGMQRAGNLIRVAPMAQLNKERELRLAQLKQELELTPLETRLIPVSYAHAADLQARAKDLLSPRGTLAVDERTNVIIARDIAGNLNHVEELVRSLDTQTPQVLIEARIVEATSNYNRDLGIQWGGTSSFSASTGNATGLSFPSAISLSGGNYDNNSPTAGLSPLTRTVTVPNFAVNLPAAVGTDSGGALGLSLGSIDNAFNLALRLSALESSGLVRIVSNPRILTLDNHDARINQGTLIPYSQVSAQGVQTSFQEAKLQLLVKPHVTADGSVSMHVKVNRDEPDFNQTAANGAPTILKREAETELLVPDGHTAVIGGIFTRNTGRNLDQVPFFGDIPIIGILFQRRRANDQRGELVIFITPRIINRGEALGH
jgi:type IV pilus assembly protein PilQ